MRLTRASESSSGTAAAEPAAAAEATESAATTTEATATAPASADPRTTPIYLSPPAATPPAPRGEHDEDDEEQDRKEAAADRWPPPPPAAGWYAVRLESETPYPRAMRLDELHAPGEHRRTVVLTGQVRPHDVPRLCPASASVTMPSSPWPTSMRTGPCRARRFRRGTTRSTMPGIPPGIADIGLRADLPLAADGKRDFGRFAVADRGERHHRDLRSGGGFGAAAPGRPCSAADCGIDHRREVVDVPDRLGGNQRIDTAGLRRHAATTISCSTATRAVALARVPLNRSPAAALARSLAVRLSLLCAGLLGLQALVGRWPCGCRSQDPMRSRPRQPGVGVVALPYDRDSVLASLEARAGSPRPHTARLDTLFARFRGPFVAYTTARVCGRPSCATPSLCCGPTRFGWPRHTRVRTLQARVYTIIRLAHCTRALGRNRTRQHSAGRGQTS